MRRQTKKHYVQDRGYYLSCSEFCREDGCGECSSLDEAVDRLGAYEDTGLMPEEFDAYWKFLRDLIGDQKASETLLRFRELAKADRDGRVIVLPCRVGDTVWTNISIRGDRYRLSDRPYPVKVVFFGNGGKKRFFHVEYSNGRVFPFDKSAIGKHVFLTREEAEKALEEAKNNG